VRRRVRCRFGGVLRRRGTGAAVGWQARGQGERAGKKKEGRKKGKGKKKRKGRRKRKKEGRKRKERKIIGK
jgi:hypothetical protein